jgi:hypothetical protein
MKKDGIQVSVIGLGAEVYVLKYLAQQTGSDGVEGGVVGVRVEVE